MKLSSEDGAILLIVAIIATTLLIFAGLAIDGSILATSKVQQRHTAEFIALGALKAASQNGGNNWERLDAAVMRARQIAGNNVFFAEPFLKIPGQTKNLGTNQGSASPIGGEYTDTHGRIVPGVWYFKPTSQDCNVRYPTAPLGCPCQLTDATEYVTPCFRELDFTVPTDLAEEVNAFKVILQTSSASPIRTLFARISGHEYVSVLSEATAAFIARYGVFLADLSRSVHGKTHLHYEKATAKPPIPAGSHEWKNSSESAFRISQINGGAPTCRADHLNECYYQSAPFPPPPNCTFFGGVVEGLFDEVYNFVALIDGDLVITTENNRPAAPNDKTESTKHYKSDFGCFSVNYSDYLPDASVDGPFEEFYLVDTYRGDTDTGALYDGPEPLTSIRAGLYHGLKLFEARQVDSDRVGLVGFDRSATIDKRVFATKASGEPKMVAVSDPAFTKMLEATDVERCKTNDAGCDNTTKDEKQFTEAFFFPRVLENNPRGNTNIPEALRTAYNMLLGGPNPADADNFVVLVSDGLTTCTSERACGTDYAAFQASFAESESIINDRYVKDNIRFDMILIGDSGVGVHTKLIPYPTGDPERCATDSELRLEYPPVSFVDADSYASGTAEDAFNDMQKGRGTFFGSHAFYTLVRATDGYWLPIREPCSAGTDVTPDLDTECAKGTTPVVKAPYTIDLGRLICEPGGKSIREQLIAAWDKIFGKSPYVLVE